MRKILLFLLLCSTAVAFSQEDTIRLLKEAPTQNDTFNGKLQQVTDRSAKSIEMKQWEDRNIKAILQISEQVEKNRAREKRNAYLRIGIGVAFLIVLIVGLMRKRAKK